MNTYHSRYGGLWVKGNDIDIYLGIGGSYIEDRIILLDQLHPSENKNWHEYFTWRILKDEPASISHDGIITVHSVRYGDFKFLKNDRGRYDPNASSIGYQKTKTQSAIFYDFNKRFSNSYDTSRVIY